MAGVVLWSGDFGRAVATQLVNHGWREQPLDEPSAVARAMDGTDTLLFASWRERQDLAAALDDACWNQRVPWVPVIAEHPWVRVGPAITPDRSPCHGCFRARRRQNDANRDLTAALDAAYLADPRLGVRGHLPHHATIAVGLVQLLLAESPGWRAPIVRYHTLWNEIVKDHVVGVHNCPRCDSGRTARNNAAISACIGGPVDAP